MTHLDFFLLHLDLLRDRFEIIMRDRDRDRDNLFIVRNTGSGYPISLARGS